MTTRAYIFRIVNVARVLDGDTYDLVVDVGFHLHAMIRVRLLGWDTPERTKGSDFEKAEGLRAKAAAEAWLGTLHLGGSFWVRTEKDTDSFGRWLGDVWCETETGDVEHLGAALALDRLATPWPQRWRELYDSPAS